jgi:hypothetical protein
LGFTLPTVADFKTAFARDFAYGATTDVVMDSDIQSALNDAGFNFPRLFTNQVNFTTAYLNLAAHWLVTNLGNSTKGLAGQFTWLTQSKSVGNVSEAFGIPQYILDKPAFAMLCKTRYGAKYLALLLPSLVGQTFSVGRRTESD